MQSAIGRSCPAEESNWHHRARPNRRKNRYPFIRSLPTHSCRGANSLLTQRPTAGLLPADDTEGAIRFGDKPFYESMFAQLPRKLESRKASAGTRFRHIYSTLLRSVGTEFKVMRELLRHSTLRSTLDVYTQAITPAKHVAQSSRFVISLFSEANPTLHSPSSADIAA